MNHSFTIVPVTTASSALARQVAELTILAWGREPTESEMAQRAERFLAEIAALEPSRQAVFAALDERDLVGVSRVMCSADDPVTWVHYGLAVHPQHQRRGVGRALTKAAILYAEQRGARSIRSDVHADNRASLLFHRGIRFGSEEFVTDMDGDRIARFRLELVLASGTVVSGHDNTDAHESHLSQQFHPMAVRLELDTERMSTIQPSPRLIIPADGYGESLLEMVDEYRRAGEQRYHDVAELARRDVPSYLRYLHERAAGRVAEQVIQHTFWLVLDRQIIGASRIRPCLTPALEEWGGNVAYDVRPSQRRHGYGTTLLTLTLSKARDLGLRQVLAMCYQDNTASVRVLEKNGARLLRQGHSERAKGEIFVYALDL